MSSYKKGLSLIRWVFLCIAILDIVTAVVALFNPNLILDTVLKGITIESTSTLGIKGILLIASTMAALFFFWISVLIKRFVIGKSDGTILIILFGLDILSYVVDIISKHRFSIINIIVFVIETITFILILLEKKSRKKA